MDEFPLRGLDPAEELDPTKPPFEREYLEWLWDKLEVSKTADIKASYEATAQQLVHKFRESVFWKNLPRILGELNATYKVQTGVQLLGAPGQSPTLDVKTWDSFWEKTYRLNVFNNRRWPDPPLRGWIIPSTWISQVGDVVRTKFIVRYLDGMDLVSTAIARAAEDCGLRAKIGRIAKIEGYYATHVDIAFPITVSTGLDLVREVATIEIQVATELQDNIYELTHRLYAARRLETYDETNSWQWNYASDEFASNYLGHVLHYLEGMIMRLREAPDDRFGR